MELPQLDYLPTVPVALRRGAELHGDRDFVVMPDRRLSFRQAEAASRRVAKQLIAAGVGKGTRVAIHYANSPEWIVAFFAVTRIGAIALPLSTAYKPAELRKALKHSDAQVFITPPDAGRAGPPLVRRGRAPEPGRPEGGRRADAAGRGAVPAHDLRVRRHRPGLGPPDLPRR